MTEALPPTHASRRRRHGDVRVLIGFLLVMSSIAAVVGIVTAADDGEDVLAAPRLLTAGELITTDDLEVRRVSLGIDGHGYLRAADVPEGGLVVSRTIGVGELVPLAAVGDARGPSATTIVVTLSTAIGATVRPGDVLDLWSAPALDAGRFGAPAVVASETQLVRVIAEEGIVSTGQAGQVELLIARRDVARILHALANGDALSAVPSSLAIGG
jgi:hypothetical protein